KPIPRYTRHCAFFISKKYPQSELWKKERGITDPIWGYIDTKKTDKLRLSSFFYFQQVVLRVKLSTTC
ncbi:hypothetical protein, partial [Myroides sp. DF42-4-2]|uniref:hypothetical protein n=1 Tax=Myroides sp. DF42-4-2 TaxID=2746726 RepID=UPI002577211A